MSAPDRTHCRVCDRPRETQDDFDKIAPGDGAHLCWGAWDEGACYSARVDWYERAMAARAARDAATQAFDDLVAQVWRATGEEHEPPADVAALVARVRRLQALVAVLVTHERDNSHSHACVGTWDRSNGAPLGGAPCARCHTFANAREAVGLPRWPTRDEYHQRAEDRPATCEHPAACGCGAELYTHTTAHTAPRRSP